MTGRRGSYGDGPEEHYFGAPDDLDDWGAEDWENFWSEPEEPSAASSAYAADSPWAVIADDDADAPFDMDDPPRLQAPVSPAAAQATKRITAEGQKPSPLELARHFEKKFLAAPNAWDAAQASANFRRARQPELAIKLVIRAHTILAGKASANERAAMLTTVGAAYADLHRFEIAVSAGTRAVTLAPANFRAWRVLGRAARHLGLHGKADQCFARASELEKEESQQRR
jgi:tetratricopeptide (TPR) repeat protein